MHDFDDVWRRVVENAGREFHQYRGKVFMYSLQGRAISLSTTNQVIGRNEIKKAWEREPRKVSDLQDLRGPSYLFAIVTDPRIR